MDLERAMEFALERQAAFEAQMAAIDQQLAEVANRQAESERRSAETNAILRRAIRLGVEEARLERKKRRELDTKLSTALASLAVAQEETQRSLKAYFDSLKKSTNGH
jgi:hypothetical protein